MGKVKKLRQKYHLSLKKSKSLKDLSEAEEQKSGVKRTENLTVGDDQIFSGIDISWEDIRKELPKDFDVRSVVSSKSRKELKEEEKHLKKKDKIKLRHQRFINKLDVTHQLLKASKSKKRKEKKSKEGDMTALWDALPSLQSSLGNNSSNEKCGKQNTKQKGILKAKHRLKQQALDSKIFKHILNDKTFRENPLQAVTQYLKQKAAVDA